MVDLCVALSQLDALISLAEVAQERQYVKPEISDENVIVIKNGRHPLQVMLAAFFCYEIRQNCLGADHGVRIYCKRHLRTSFKEHRTHYRG